MDNSENNETLEFDLIDAASLRRMGSLLWRNAWIIALAAILTGMAAFIYSRLQAPVYQASAQVLISRPSMQSQIIDITQSMNSQQITQTYVEMLQLTSVRQAASDKLGFPVETGKIQISALTNTQMIEIRVENTNAQRAADIANTLVDVLIEKNEEIQSGRYISSEENLNAQIADMDQQIVDLQSQIKERSTTMLAEQKVSLETQIDALKSQISAMQTEIAGLPTEQANQRRGELEQLQALQRSYENAYAALIVQKKPVTNDDEQLTQLEKTATLYQQIYLNLLNSRESLRLARLQNTLNVAKIDTAQINPNPVSPRVSVNTMFGFIVGLLLAISLIFARDFLDDTLKSRDDIKRLFGLSTLGVIPDHQTEQTDGLFVAEQPRSPITESYRALRTNLEFSSVDHALKTILITSAGPGEGKTTVCTNLAGVLAQAGKKVLLIDTDLRRPKVHQYLGLGNRFGLTDLFLRQGGLADVIQVYEGPNNTRYEVITTGAMPPNPGELLSSDRMHAILAEACQHAGIVIIDSAPSLVADSQALSASVDGILIVVEAGETRAEPVRATLESFRRAQAHILGLVLNRLQNHHNAYNGYQSGYYYHGYGDENRIEEKKNRLPWQKKKA